MRTQRLPSHAGECPRHGLARVLSKSGVCSRSQAQTLVRSGRVTVNGLIVTDPESPTRRELDRLAIDGEAVASAAPLHVMLNKPRGLVSSVSDERGRDTVYKCLRDAGLPWLAPVGRLDKASEGLLLFSNDPEWAARITDPDSGPRKTYHVQVDALPDAALLARLAAGAQCDGEWLKAHSVRVLRTGQRNAWLEIVLDEGRNRQIRRLLAACDLAVLRLVRVAIGGLLLGDLGKSQWRHLRPDELAMLFSPATVCPD